MTSLFTLVAPYSAIADYAVFDLNPVPDDQLQSLTTEWQMVGASNGNKFTVKYIADSSVTLFDRVDIPLCRLGGTNTGRIDLEVRTTSSTSPIVASSTLAVNSGNVWTTGCTSTYINATTSTFVLNQNLQWVADVELYFTFYMRNTDGTIYMSFDVNGGTPGLTWYNNGEITVAGGYSYDYNASMLGRALGSVPTNQNQGIYNASTTAVICDTFDIGCYISTAVSWAFYPQISLSDQLATLASTTSGVVPFGYVADLYSKFETYSNAATTSLTISVELSPLMNFLGGSQASTTVTLLSGSGLRTVLGSTMWNLIQNLIAAFLWVAFGFYIYRRSIHLL